MFAILSKLTTFGAYFQIMLANIPHSEHKRVVIVGAGFGGLKLGTPTFK